MKDIVYFDLETQKTANDVGGWANKHLMMMSIGVLFSHVEGEYLIYAEDEVHQMIERMNRADLIIGYNHISFDYEVLMGYSIVDLKSQLPSFDLMVDLEKQLGFRLKLESLATATLGAGKSADGLEAIKWWKEGKLAEIAEYCCYDVKVTRLVHEYGAKHGHVIYNDQGGHPKKAEVSWTL